MWRLFVSFLCTLCVHLGVFFVCVLCVAGVGWGVHGERFVNARVSKSFVHRARLRRAVCSVSHDHVSNLIFFVSSLVDLKLSQESREPQ